MDNGSKTDLYIRRLPHGGFVVRDCAFDPQYGRHALADLFASGDIEEALYFIRQAIVPIGGPLSPHATSQTTEE